MARYGGNKHRYDIRDVFRVAIEYNRIWREYTNFPQQGRPSDYDLWRVGKPALSSEGTIGEGVARLRFVFQDYETEDAEHWVRKFIRANKVPYTNIKTTPIRTLRVPPTATYVEVAVEFEMHPDNR